MRYVNEKKIDYAIIIAIFGFILTSQYVVPYFHELGHISALEYFDCNYWSKLEYGFFNEFYGSVYHVCEISQKQEALIYLSGVALTFIIGIILLIIEHIFHKRHKIEIAIPLMFIAYAFLLDFINYLFFPQGDLYEILKMYGLESKAKILPALGLIYVLLLLTYLYLNLSKELNVLVIEEEHIFKKTIRKIKKLRNKINRKSKQ